MAYPLVLIDHPSKKFWTQILRSVFHLFRVIKVGSMETIHHKPDILTIGYSNDAFPNVAQDVNFGHFPTDSSTHSICLPRFAIYAHEHQLWERLAKPRTFNYAPNCCLVIEQGKSQSILDEMESNGITWDTCSPSAFNEAKCKAYRYVVYCESCIQPYFVTETLLKIWLYGSIPIYCGGQKASTWCNGASFVEWKQQESVIRLKELETNPELHKQMYKEPFILQIPQEFEISLVSQTLLKVSQSLYWWQKVQHVYIICSKEHEVERFNYLTTMMDKMGIPNYTMWCVSWGALTHDQITEFRIATHLKTGEMSLIYNFYSLAKHIGQVYKSGKFVIMESDVLFTEHFAKRMGEVVDSNDYDMIHFGNGCRCTPPNTNPNQFLYLMHKTRCTEAIMWTWEGLKKIQLYDQVTEPLDLFFSGIVIPRNKISIAWTWPSLVVQGSQNGTYRSMLGNWEG